MKINHPKPGLSKRQFVIRRAKKSDLPAIVKMSIGVKEIENYPDQKMKEDDFTHFVGGNGALMLVAEAENKVVGYLTVYQSENYFYLPYAVTKKEWRGKGVGSALLERVETLAKEGGVEYILMSVYLYNSSVHKFLKTRGYTPSKKLVQYSKLIRCKAKK
ncbi:MAG: N-acetyltransferase family protein [Candidatus Kryptoniota bacterium]